MRTLGPFSGPIENGQNSGFLVSFYVVCVIFWIFYTFLFLKYSFLSPLCITLTKIRTSDHSFVGFQGRFVLIKWPDFFKKQCVLRQGGMGWEEWVQGKFLKGDGS